MSEVENELSKSRLAKLESLKSRGIDPYPSRFRRTHTSIEAITAYEESESSTESTLESMSLCGRIMARRSMGRATFLDISDRTGKIQALFRANLLDDKYQILEDIDLGDWLGIMGKPFRTKTGQVTIQVETFQILCKAIKPLPEKWHGLTDVETRYRQRYLDLISNDKSLQTAITRSQIVSFIRRFMDKKEFIEVETPILVPVAAGGMAHPFITHHNTMNRDLFLRIATELHLKRLIVGGLERVYEIGRVFRNEGVDQQHNPEFTTMESYEAFADYKDVMLMVEQMVSQLALETTDAMVVDYGDIKLDFSPPWPRYDLRSKILETSGIDFTEHTDADTLAKAMSSKGIDVRNQVSWGGLLDKLISEKLEPTLIQPCFLIDYPLPMSPLAKRTSDDPTIVERFEGFVYGMEICNAFSELNDPIDQRKRFEEQEELHRKFAEEEMDRLDEDFLTAIEHGMPPTGGLGIGIDRLTMLLTNNKSIREVILFPQLRN